MCLQIPNGAVITDEEDPTGAHKMAKLVQILEENGMIEVDAARLTARIPVIKCNCPKPLDNGSEGEDESMECDL
jgi:DNA polymerase sigma